jgi:hypothetical protein
LRLSIVKRSDLIYHVAVGLGACVVVRSLFLFGFVRVLNREIKTLFRPRTVRGGGCVQISMVNIFRFFCFPSEHSESQAALFVGGRVV